MRERKSIGMKNFIFKSPVPSDLIKILLLVQAEQRHARYDLQLINKKLDKCVSALSLLVSAPEPEDSEEIPELEDK